VFELVGQGFSTRSIATKLNLGIDTVGTYRARIKEKLRLKGRDALLRTAIQWNASTRPVPAVK
jgi:DNA-binding CsgD family transcriptional regulator